MIRKESMLAGFSVALGVAGSCLLLYLFWRLLGAVAAMVSPFLIALVLTLVLDPIADRLEIAVPGRWPGSKRLWAVAFVFLLLLLAVAGLVAFIVPNLIAQTSRLITFFAPLNYKIERKRADGNFAVIEKEVTGSQYIVRNLQNGRSYDFRVVAADSEGRQYFMETTGTPRSEPVERQQTTRNVRDTRREIKATDRRNDRRDQDATEGNPDPEMETLPVAPPSSTPTPGNFGLLPFHLPNPTASATPTPGGAESPDSEIDTTMPDTDATGGASGATGASGVSGASSGETTRETSIRSEQTNAGDTPSPTPPGVPSPSPEPTEGPNAVSGSNSSPSPAVSVLPLREVEATPRALIDVPRKATMTPRPTATTSPAGTTASIALNPVTPAPAISSPPGTAGSTGAGTAVAPSTTVATATKPKVRLPGPGEVIAVPEDGRIHLYWRPPVAAASGFDRLRTQADQWLLEHHSIGPLRLPPNLAAIQAQYSVQLSQLFRQVSQRAADIIVGSVSTALTVTLALIITFYLLSDFDRLRMRMFHLIPEQARGGVLQTVSDVGSVFGNYVRGMTTVATAYGVVSVVVFFMLGSFFDIGLKTYALLLGVMAGVIYPIPFLGPTLTTIVIAAVSLATGATPVQVIIAAVTVQIQNAIFDNVVTPRVVGKSVGLHPLVTIFSLLLGGQLFGFLGMLLAVPVAASLQKLLIRLFPHLGEPTPMVVQNPDHREKRREETGRRETETDVTAV